MIRWKNLIYNTSFALNCLLFFLLVFGANMKVPLYMQVIGRMHPLVLHFPIVLLVIVILWEILVNEKSHPALREPGDWLLLSAVFTAVVAALMGLFLSKEAGYDKDAIAFHKWTGVGISLITLGWFAFRNSIRNKKINAVILGAISLCGIVMAGDQGANITHGENFLLAPVTPQKTGPDVLLEDAVVYKDLIRPILEAKCITCHNSNKAKGELIMETDKLLLKGGKNGKLWDSTEAGFGLLMKRIHLPLEAKEHMPPKGKPQLSEEEIKALYYWIKEGADLTKKVTELSATDSLRMIATTFFKTVETDNYTFAAADEATVKKLNTDYLVVSPVALESPALGVEFYGASFYKGDQLKELQKVGNQVVTLNLNKMPVKDEDLQYISSMINLRKLNLSFTKISGASLSQLKNLKELRQLSLSGTAVKAADLQVLKDLPKLAFLYIWNTLVKDNDMAALQKQFPTAQIGKGFRGDTMIVKLNVPVIEGDKQVFTNAIGINLKHYIKGARLNYTLDGSEPDSLNSPVYKDSILINKTGVLKTKAFLQGWGSSDVVSKNYYRAGYVADSVRLVDPPNKDYKGSGGITISDGVKGDLDFKSGNWLGYRDTSLVAYMYFNNPATLSSVSFSTLVNMGGFIMPPARLEVWGGTTIHDLVLLKKLIPPQPDSLKSAYLMVFDCNFATKKISVLKVVAKPLPRLPAWHPAKKQKAWVFIDEVFLN